MNGLNQKAWAILDSDEQLALTLKYGHKKSSWEAGEIMGKAHYKFLEIEGRAKQFLKMFTEHMEFYDEIIPKDLPIDRRAIKFFQETIEKRRTVRDAVGNIHDGYFGMSHAREKILVESLIKLLDSDKLEEKNIAILIRDFDRWNNFRILPTSIQEPSAFKRRDKNADKKNLKNITHMHTLITQEIVKRFHRPKILAMGQRVMYVPVFSQFIDKSKSVIIVRREEDNLVQLNKLGMYSFAKVHLANEFYELVSSYDWENPLSCRFGQKFWPLFRALIKQSINYSIIKKRIPSRKFLEDAINDLDLRVYAKEKAKAEANKDDYNPKPLRKIGKKVKKSLEKD